MKNNIHCKKENRRAHQFNVNQLHGRCRKTSSNHFMKIRIVLGLCVILGASLIAVRAADTPAQAAARVALEQKLNELDHLQTSMPPAPVQITPSGILVKHRAIYADAANVTGTVSEKAVTPQTALVPATPATVPAAVAFIAVAPNILLLLLSLLIISFLAMSFLLLKLLRQNSHNYGANQSSTNSGT